MLIEAEEGEWDELDRIIRRFQRRDPAIRHAPSCPSSSRPAAGRSGAARRSCWPPPGRSRWPRPTSASSRLGVGLIPAGGGSTAMAAHAPSGPPDASRRPLPVLPYRPSTTRSLAKVATSAAEACDPRAAAAGRPDHRRPRPPVGRRGPPARALAEAGYRPPAERPIPVLGRRGIAAAELADLQPARRPPAQRARPDRGDGARPRHERAATSRRAPRWPSSTCSTWSARPSCACWGCPSRATGSATPSRPASP